jgi:heat shock protein HslJ
MREWPALVAAIALGGCAEPPPEPPAPVQDAGAYAMQLPRDGPGTPFEGAIIGGEWIFDSPGAAGWDALRLPPPETEGATRRYRTKYVQLAIEAGACGVPHLRPTLPDGVRVTSVGVDLSGCGGPRPAPAGVADTHWQVLRVGGESAPKGGSPTIFAFGSEGRVGGTHACNDVGIAARWAEGRFIHPAGEPWIEGTMVGCEGPDVEFGGRFWSAMHRAVSWQRRGDRLTILFSDGRDAELRLIV